MGNYNNFSPFYDLFTQNVDYKKRTRYLMELFADFGEKPTLLLDFACGTGNFSVEFAKQGVEVIGVDLSEGMLSVAQTKNAGLKNPVLYLCQNGPELDLYGTVNGAVSCLDSLNHITNYQDFQNTVSKISLFLEKGSLFIFDMNTLYKHKQVLANSTYRLKKRGVECIWQNRLLEDDVTVEITLNFTYKCGIFKKETVTETFFEKAYTQTEIESALNRAGLKLEQIYGENTKQPPTSTTQRNVYIARKVN